MKRINIPKVAAFSTGAIVAVTCGFLVDYPELLLVQGMVFVWMFSWSYFFAKKETREKLEASDAKKH